MFEKHNKEASTHRNRCAAGQTRRSFDLPLAQLIELGYIRREVPFGETTKSTRRSLYKLNDRF